MIPQPPNSHSNPSPVPSPQDQIQSWVKQGGVLAVTPGGGIADEYNSQQGIFDEILGLNPNSRKDIRYIVGSSTNDVNHAFDMTGTMTVTDPSFGSGTMDISNPIGQLAINSADPNRDSIAARLRRGITDLAEPAITLHKYGSGYGIAYAFFPGFHYQQSANSDDPIGEPSQQIILPYGWGKLQRDIIIAPAKIANGNQGTPKPIAITYVTRDGKTQDTMVETCLLESEKGIAIVLLNWSGMPGPINDLTVTINNSTTSIPVGSRISSAQGNAITPNL
jgi:hypothetical protein